MIPGGVPLAGDLGGAAPLEDMHIEPGGVEIEVGEPLEFEPPVLLVDADAEPNEDEGYEDEDDEDAADEPQEALAPAPPGEGLDCALAVAGFDPFAMVTVCERLHGLDLGLTKFLFQLVSKYANAQQLKDRAASIPHFPGLIYWSDLPARLAAGHLQGKEFRSLLKILVVLSYRLAWKQGPLPVGKTRHFTLPADFGAKFTKCASLYAEFYEFTVLSEHTAETIMHLQDLCRRCRQQWIDNLLPLSPSKLNFVKFHFIMHTARQITLFGAGDVCNVEAMEAMHKDPKAAFRRLNKQVHFYRPDPKLHSKFAVCSLSSWLTV